MEKISNRLRRLRTRRGLSQKEVAAQIGVPQSTYRDWEYGKKIVGEPYVDLAQVFEVSLVELLNGKKTEASDLLLRLTELEELVRTIRIAVASLL